MLIDIFSSFGSIATALFFLLFAGIMGYILHYLLSRRGLHAKFELLRNQFSGFDSRLNGVDKKVKSLETQWPKFEERFQTLESQQENFETAQNEAHKKIDLDFGELKKNQTLKFTSLTTQLTDATSELAGMKSSFTPFETGLKSQAQNLEALKTKMTSLNSEREKKEAQLDEKIKSAVKSDDIKDFIKMSSLGEFAKKSDIPSSLTQAEVKGFIGETEKNWMSKLTGTESKIKDWSPQINQMTSKVQSLETEKLDKVQFEQVKKLETQLQSLTENLNQLKKENKDQDDEISALKLALKEKNSKPVAAPAPVKKAAPIAMDSRGVPTEPIVDKLSIRNIRVQSHEKDDLKLIKGIGPFIEEKVNALGITTFKQVAALTHEDVDLVTDAIQFFPGRILRDDWMSQAQQLKNQTH